MKRIEIYSADNCPWCDRAKSLLLARRLDFEEIDISADAARTVPQIFIEDEHIGGFDELSMLNLSDRLY